MDNKIEKYRDILFSFVYRDEEFPAVIKAKGFSIKGAVITILRSLFEEINALLKGTDKHLHDKIWIYADSINQFRSLEFLTQLPESVFVTNSKKLISSLPDAKLVAFSNPYKLKSRILRLGKWNLYHKLFGSRVKTHFNTIFRHDGIYESLVNYFNHIRPKAIVMANDHNAVNRALLLAAKELNIKCIYLQHASVTNRFPPLKFDLNLLDGNDSLNKYKEAGPIEGSFKLIGMPKFDAFYNAINRNLSVKSIGIAINATDNINNYINVSELLKLHFPNLSITFRYHPAVNVIDLIRPDGILISDPKKESSFDFLKRIDMLLAGNSSIHLEATLMNVNSFSIHFESQKPELDYYGFIKNGMISVLEFDETIICNYIRSHIESKPSVRSKAKNYVETIDTAWDGRSSEKVLDLLKEYCR